MPQCHAPTTDAGWTALLGPAADATSEALLVFDVEGRIRAANAAARAMGRGRELVGLTATESGFLPRHPDGRPMTLDEQPSVRALRTGTAQRDTRVRVDRRNGAVEWLSVSAVPLVAADAAQPYGVVTSIVDITPLVEATETLREREQELALMTAHSGDLIARHRADGTIVQATGRAQALLGVAPEQLVGMRAADVCHPDDRDAVLEATRLAGQGRASVVAYRVRPRGSRGPELWLESTVSPLRAPDGETEAISTTRDISARKAVEQRLRHAEEEARRQQAQLQQAQAMAQLGSWAMDLDTRQPWWSDNLFRLFGLDHPDDLLAAHDALVHPDDAEAVRAALAQAARTGEPFELTYRLRRPDGQERVMHGRGAPAERDADGRITRVWGTTQDVTDLHALELERRAAERRFRIAFEHAPIGVAVMGLHGEDRGRWLNVNPAMTELLGHDRETLLASRA